MTTTRTADAIFADIANAQSVSDLAALWREMARVAGRDGSPAWAVTAAALLADQYTRDAAAPKPPPGDKSWITMEGARKR